MYTQLVVRSGCSYLQWEDVLLLLDGLLGDLVELVGRLLQEALQVVATLAHLIVETGREGGGV
jgi:hypothetical protein